MSPPTWTRAGHDEEGEGGPLRDLLLQEDGESALALLCSNRARLVVCTVLNRVVPVVNHICKCRHPPAATEIAGEAGDLAAQVPREDYGMERHPRVQVSGAALPREHVGEVREYTWFVPDYYLIYFYTYSFTFPCDLEVTNIYESAQSFKGNDSDSDDD